VRAPASKPRWLNPAPCTAAKGMYLVGARKQELPGATLLGNAVDVTWKRNGGEYAWSFLRTSRAFDVSSTKRRCRGRWQKFAAVPEEISSARCREKPAVCRCLVTPISQSCSRKRTSAAAAGMSALCPPTGDIRNERGRQPRRPPAVGLK